MKITVESSTWDAYALLDSGHGRKLERFGQVVLDRPEPKAWWSPEVSPRPWKEAHAVFEDTGDWSFRGTARIPRSWTVELDGILLELRLTNMSKHVGVFPEQEPHWSWLRAQIQARSGGQGPGPTVLNLFGYTGAASLVAASAGAEVTHVDASKPALSWARHNQALSQMDQKPIRWLLDDAVKFVRREQRRQRRYSGVLLDPPSFGRGPKGEIWKVEESLIELLQDLRSILLPDGFLILTVYNLEASALMLQNALSEVFGNGSLSVGELALRTEGSNRFLPLSLFGRWNNG